METEGTYTVTSTLHLIPITSNETLQSDQEDDQWHTVKSIPKPKKQLPVKQSISLPVTTPKIIKTVTKIKEIPMVISVRKKRSDLPHHTDKPTYNFFEAIPRDIFLQIISYIDKPPYLIALIQVIFHENLDGNL